MAGKAFYRQHRTAFIAALVLAWVVALGLFYRARGSGGSGEGDGAVRGASMALLEVGGLPVT